MRSKERDWQKEELRDNLQRIRTPCELTASTPKTDLRFRSDSCLAPLTISGLRSLVDRQRIALLDASPFVTVLEDWINNQPDEVVKWHTFVELFQVLEPLARAKKLTWRWNNSQALSRHIISMLEPLKKSYSAELLEDEDDKLGKTVYRIRFAPAV